MPRALVLVVIATLGFEFAGVFYNAMLPEITSEDRIGRLSGWAWSLGYFGGIVCLVGTAAVYRFFPELSGHVRRYVRQGEGELSRNG